MSLVEDHITIDPRQVRGVAPYDPQDAFLLGLAKSIQEHGMWYPPIIKASTFELVAGEKRIQAAILAGRKELLFSTVPDGLEEEYYATIRLHENLKRRNLPWYEEIILEKKLHELYIKQHGQRGRGGEGSSSKKSGAGWSLRETAKELEMSFGVLSEDLRMAEAILADPALRRIEDKKTAKKIILESYKRINQENDSGAPVEVEKNIVHFGGSDIILKAYPEHSFDACITDPPWLKFKDPALTKDEFTLNVFRQVYRTLKKDAFLYAFVSSPDFHIYLTDLAAIGFTVSPIPLIWIKEGVLTQGTRSWEYQRDYEPILLAVKGSPALTSSMLSSIFSTKIVHSSRLVHPNEKPVEVIKRIVDHCTYDNACIVDPFAGSGVVGEVCKQMGRDYVLIEKDRKFFTQIQERLKK